MELQDGVGDVVVANVSTGPVRVRFTFPEKRHITLADTLRRHEGLAALNGLIGVGEVASTFWPLQRAPTLEPIESVLQTPEDWQGEAWNRGSEVRIASLEIHSPEVVELFVGAPAVIGGAFAVVKFGSSILNLVERFSDVALKLQVNRRARLREGRLADLEELLDVSVDGALAEDDEALILDLLKSTLVSRRFRARQVADYLSDMGPVTDAAIQVLDEVESIETVRDADS